MTTCDIINLELTIIGRHLVVKMKITTCDAIYLEFHPQPHPQPHPLTTKFQKIPHPLTIKKERVGFRKETVSFQQP